MPGPRPFTPDSPGRLLAASWPWPDGERIDALTRHRDTVASYLAELQRRAH
jgi:hypothetical protein